LVVKVHVIELVRRIRQNAESLQEATHDRRDRGSARRRIARIELADINRASIPGISAGRKVTYLPKAEEARHAAAEVLTVERAILRPSLALSEVRCVRRPHRDQGKPSLVLIRVQG